MMPSFFFIIFQVQNYGVGGAFEQHIDALVSSPYKHHINFVNQHRICHWLSGISNGLWQFWIYE